MTHSQRNRVFLLVCLLGTACTRGTSELRQLVPSLSEEMAGHLKRDGNAAFRTYARNIGMQAIGVAFIQVLIAPSTASLPEFERDESRLAPALDKLVATLGDDFGLTAVSNRQRAYTRYPAKDRLEIIRLIKEHRALILEDKRGAEDKARTCLALLERSKPYGDAIDLANLYAFYITLLPQLKKRDQTPHYYDLAVEAALRNGDFDQASQLLGSVGVYFAQRNELDRMRTAWNRGIELARQAGSWQEARILNFYSSFYQNEGRFALSREMMRKAQDRCRELGQSRAEIRFLVDGATLAANLGYWPAIGQQLQRADVLLREGEKFWSAEEREYWDIRVKRCRALYLSSVGRCAESEVLARQIIEQASRMAPSETGVTSQLEAIRLLRKCGELAEALHFLQDRNAFAHKNGVQATPKQWDMETAELCFALGDYRGCRTSLNTLAEARRAQGETMNMEWLRSDALDIRLAMVDGKKAVARRRVVESLQSLKKVRSDLDLSPEAALALPVACELGDLAHELLDTDAESGYMSEMAWRMENARLSRGPGSGLNGVQAPSLGAVLGRLSDQDAAHCVYRVETDRVLRWTAYRGRVVCDELPLSIPDLEEKVQAIRSAVEESRAASDTLIREGADLARSLLPVEFLADHGPRRILITPDGPLTQLPFEALNVSSMSYVPLLEHTDVAYVLFDRPRRTVTPASALIVSEPDYSAELKRRYSILTEKLPLGANEATAFARLFTNVAVISGPTATKEGLLRSWTQSGVLYFAAHIVQDPELPYVAFLPLAGSSTDRKEDEYLDIVDVRNADLSHCGLVVLSSCGSGSSLVVGRLSTPSLAQAFVEAGAQAVISTSWSVKDEDAGRLMHAFAAGYGPAGEDPVRALNQARRQLLEEGAAPRQWASYSVLLGAF